MRLRYRSRREALVDALADELPAAHPVGAPAGTHTLIMLEDGSDETAVERAAAARGVGVVGLAAHYAGAVAPARPGLVLGYGSLPEPAIQQGVALLAQAARDAGA
jgi:GntR family transcriptional regulator/MocR family aminotransferase